MSTGAIILAAGMPPEGERFMPMMCVDGSPIVMRVADLLQEAKLLPVVVVTGYRADQIKRCLEDRKFIFVHNRKFMENRMIDSVKLALPVLKDKCDRIMIVPADMPMLQKKTIRSLLQGKARITVPCRCGQSGHPLVVDASVAEKIAAYEGENGLRGFMAAEGISPEKVEVEDAGIALDVNTQAEYLDVLALRDRLAGKGRLHMECRIQLAVDEVVLDADIVGLIKMVGYTGSIQLAAECVNIPYTKAWRQIKNLESQLNIRIIDSCTGGKRGGGSRLTEQGTELIEQFCRFEKDGTRMLRMLYNDYEFDEIVQKS